MLCFIAAHSGSSYSNSGSHSNITSEKCSCDEKIAELMRSHEQERRLHEQERESHEQEKRSHEVEVAKLQQQLRALQDHVSYDHMTSSSP